MSDLYMIVSEDADGQKSIFSEDLSSSIAMATAQQAVREVPTRSLIVCKQIYRVRAVTIGKIDGLNGEVTDGTFEVMP